MRKDPIVGVHLDLKGIVFKSSYIPQYLADLAGQGINTVLLEYEDLFPFDAGRGVDVARVSSEVWSHATLVRFQSEAGQNGIEVIPLQQCLGHLEYVFQWRRYRRLALDRQYPSTLDLGNPQAKKLVFEMLVQVMEAHPQSRFVHLGMDEAHALVGEAKKRGCGVLDLFLNHLRELCDLCRRHDKMPVIWSDMLEDHFRPGLFDDLKDRVVLMPWDYGSTGLRIGVGRLAGFRTSRRWLDEPENPLAPALNSGHTFIEEMPASVRKLAQPYIKEGRWFVPMFQMDFWADQGFRVLGASAIRNSGDLATLPHYNLLMQNIQAWSRAVKRTRQLGQIGTSWGRGTSWCPPGFNPDLTWPLVGELGQSMGRKVKPFWPGVPARSVQRIVRTLGRCRADWRIEGLVAKEMETLAPQVKSHRYEWDSLALMTRVMELQRRVEYIISEVDFFHANARPAEPEWQRRLREQAQALKQMQALKKKVKTHFARRYRGHAFEEWVNDLFDLYAARVRDCRRICRDKLKRAKKVYA